MQKRITIEDFIDMSKDCPWQLDGSCMGRPTDFIPSEDYGCGCCGTASRFEYDSCDYQECPVVFILNSNILRSGINE
jgi:hypothetical protein